MALSGTITRYVFAADFEKLFTQMVAISIAAHVVLFATAVFVPNIFGNGVPDTEPIEVDLSYTLPKGPGVGPRAPDRDQTAVRQSDPRRATDIMKERSEKITADTVKIAKRRDVETNKLDWKDRQRMSAVERLRERKALQETYGGGGQSSTSTTGVLGIYISNVRNRILSVWSLPGGLPAEYLEKAVYIRIFVSSSGSVIKAVLAQPSGFEPLDRSCQSAIVKASPLPSPPTLLVDEMRDKGMLIRFYPRTKAH